MTFDVLVVGIGGQGVLTAADAIARAALACGYDATKTEVTGMSQRGGVVCSQVRFGQKVSASEIRAGAARLVIAFEAAEALRWSHYLAGIPGAPCRRSCLPASTNIPPILFEIYKTSVFRPWKSARARPPSDWATPGSRTA